MVSSAGFRKRDIAHKITIINLLNAPYVKTESDQPNYIEWAGMQIGRINVIGVLVSKEQGDIPSVVLDDGSGLVRVTIFDEAMYDQTQVGSTALIIGRIREYDGSRYISAEIVKGVDSRWADVRKRELSRQVQSQDKEEVAAETVIGNGVSTKVYELVKELDEGNGADTSIILEKVDDAEQIIKSLLETGDLFEVAPGKLKVLE